MEKLTDKEWELIIHALEAKKKRMEYYEERYGEGYDGEVAKQYADLLKKIS